MSISEMYFHRLNYTRLNQETTLNSASWHLPAAQLSLQQYELSLFLRLGSILQTHGDSIIQQRQWGNSASSSPAQLSTKSTVCYLAGATGAGMQQPELALAQRNCSQCPSSLKTVTEEPQSPQQGPGHGNHFISCSTSEVPEQGSGPLKAPKGNSDFLRSSTSKRWGASISPGSLQDHNLRQDEWITATINCGTSADCLFLPQNSFFNAFFPVGETGLLEKARCMGAVGTGSSSLCFKRWCWNYLPQLGRHFTSLQLAYKKGIEEDEQTRWSSKLYELTCSMRKVCTSSPSGK